MAPGLHKLALLSGGVGGAKLALGLSRVLAPDQLAIIANTGDDFRHLGLAISPDLDTLMYTLAGTVNPETGWGCRDESWAFMDALAALGGETWFRLGDRDLATHVERTRRLADGQTLTAVTEVLCRQLGVSFSVLPMSDQPAPTQLETDEGTLAFQDYFVRRRAAPRIRRVHCAGARPTPEVLALLSDPALGAVVIAPSNPYLSIDPILALPGIREALQASAAPVIAVSPIVGGRALKGPTAKIMAELGLEPAALTVARHYQPLLAGFILDQADAPAARAASALGMKTSVVQTIMRTINDRVALARETLAFARKLKHD